MYFPRKASCVLGISRTALCGIYVCGAFKVRLDCTNAIAYGQQLRAKSTLIHPRLKTSFVFRHWSYSRKSGEVTFRGGSIRNTSTSSGLTMSDFPGYRAENKKKKRNPRNSFGTSQPGYSPDIAIRSMGVQSPIERMGTPGIVLLIMNTFLCI